MSQSLLQWTASQGFLPGYNFPRLPVRQWVLSVPKRLRYFMQRDGAVLNMVLRIWVGPSPADHQLRDRLLGKTD